MGFNIEFPWVHAPLPEGRRTHLAYGSGFFSLHRCSSLGSGDSDVTLAAHGGQSTATQTFLFLAHFSSARTRPIRLFWRRILNTPMPSEY
ncbi:hypothetical protein CEXT_678971 [Caerostris extrusa]|uniref:Uncharacterized protein n=1 Tax=Caerostris extrusa TaxID=172846 RepID=A0AAV4NE68_CAEEX|nr:hypothetical protein CEXT_678971 [Caerostris extrusa]